MGLLCAGNTGGLLPCIPLEHRNLSGFRKTLKDIIIALMSCPLCVRGQFREFASAFGVLRNTRAVGFRRLRRV
jgi:hypothetical protein